jgi:opacity protein-like surface antigen
VARRLLVLICVAWLQPAVASADWLITPFAGIKFGGESCPCPNVPLSVIVDPEGAAGLRKFMFGGSFGILTDGVLGAEIDFGYIPGYFNRADALNTVEMSSVMTLTGDVLIAVPAAVSRDGLRPYLVGGLGWMRVAREGVGVVVGIVDPTNNRLAINFGGGAIGRLTNRTSLRFELRQFRDVEDLDSDLPLRFWRATVGVAFRY